MNAREILVFVSAAIVTGFSAARAQPAPGAARPQRALDPAAAPALRAGKAVSDTFWFGGTHWDAIQSRWEANMSTSRTNRWTFDSGVDGNSEGWRGHDMTVLPLPTCPRPPVGVPDNSDFRWTNASLYALYGTPGAVLFPPVNPPDLGGIWCSKYKVEADELCWVDGQSYDDNWNHEAKKAFIYGGAGDVRLSFKYFNNSEKNYDFTYLYLEFNGARETSPRATMTFTLGSPGSKRTRTFTVSGAAIPAGTTQIAAVFKFTSSSVGPIWGLPAGPFCCYNFNYEDLGTPANSDEDTFEQGPEGWQFFQPPAVGDYVRVADIGSLTPPGVPCAVLQGNVLVSSDAAGPPRHPDGQDAFALSPLIDLDEFGLGGLPAKLAFADAFMDLPVTNSVYYKLWLKQYPVLCATTGQYIEAYQAPDPFITFTPNPACYRDVVFEDFSASAPDIDYCYLAIEVLNLCSVSTQCTNPTGGNESPYWDNLALAVTQEAIVGGEPATVPKANALEISPNPFNPLVRFSYALASPGRATLRIYDVRGALVATLVDEMKSAGRYEALWNGTSDAGQRAASGVFWARYEAPGSGIVKQLVLLK